MIDTPPTTRSGVLRPERISHRHVFSTAAMTDEDARRIIASMPTEEEVRTGRWAWQTDAPTSARMRHDHDARPDEPQSDPAAAADHVALYPWELSGEAMEAIRNAVSSAESSAMNVLMDDPSDAGGMETIVGTIAYEPAVAATSTPAPENNEPDQKVDRCGN